MSEIVNHLWQSTLFALAAGIVVLALRNHGGRVRYWIWLAASLKFLLPFSLLVSAGRQIETPVVMTPAVAERVGSTFLVMSDPLLAPTASADLVALMAYRSGSVEVFQDFTGDRRRLLEIIETLIVGEDENAPIDESARADMGAAFGQNDAEFSIFFTDRQLAALQTAATMLGRLNEKKSLLYFASGLRLNGANNQAQLNATINAAVRAGVSLWPIDARGLVAQAPLGDATQGSPGGAGA